jgi:hypothetical protein
MEITFSIKGREFFEGLLVSSLKRIFPRAGFFFFPIIMLIGLLGVLGITNNPGSLLSYSLILFGLLLLGLAAVPILRAIQYSRNKRLSAPMTWKIGDQRIEIRSERGESKTNWKSFERPTETWHLFLLFSTVNKQSIYILPKRAFRDSAEIDRFREMARKACGKIL